MRQPRFFSSTKLTPCTEITLDDNAANHASKVLRLGIGSPITLFDGKGGEYPANLIQVGKKHVVAKTEQHIEENNASPLAIDLGIGISKGDRMDWVIQKATELGAQTISPLFTERVEVRLKGERLQKKLTHWRNISISACEQCGLNIPPKINEPISIEPWLSHNTSEVKLVLHHRHNQQIKKDTAKSVSLLVGPEGGLSEIEIQQAIKSGFQEYKLGPRVLRTETAPIVAMSLLQHQWGDI